MPRGKEWWQLDFARVMEEFPWLQKNAYVEDMSRNPPGNFPEESEGWQQFTYNPRLKRSREYAKTLQQELPLRKKQTKKNARKKTKKIRGA